MNASNLVNSSTISVGTMRLTYAPGWIETKTPGAAHCAAFTACEPLNYTQAELVNRKVFEILE